MRVDFSPSWQRVLKWATQPNRDKLHLAGAAFNDAKSTVESLEVWLPPNAAKSFEKVKEEIEWALDKFDEANDHFIQVSDEMEINHHLMGDIVDSFLARFHGVLVTCSDKDEIDEITGWAKENLHGQFDQFILGDRIIFVIFDDLDRVAFRLRWNG